MRFSRNVRALDLAAPPLGAAAGWGKLRPASSFRPHGGEVVNCTIKRVEGPDYILDLGKTEAKLPKKEQSLLESYQRGRPRALRPPAGG